MTSAKCQNRNFLPSSFQRTQILTITHGQGCLWGSLGVPQRSSSTPLERKKKNPKLDALKRIRGTPLLYQHYCISPHPQGVTESAKRDLLGLWFLFQGKVIVSEHPAFPDLWANRPTFFSPLQNTEVCFMTRWGWTAMTLRGHRRETDSIRLSCSQTTGDTIPVDPSTHLLAPPVLYTPHPHTRWLVSCAHLQGQKVQAFADSYWTPAES